MPRVRSAEHDHQTRQQRERDRVAQVADEVGHADTAGALQAASSYSTRTSAERPDARPERERPRQARQRRTGERGEKRTNRHAAKLPPRPKVRLLARNDPTDTGGLFIGRRPGTAPLRYNDTPERGLDKRQRVDGLLANLLLVLEILVVLSCWGPQPVAWLWVGSQVSYQTDSIFLGIAAAFLGLLARVMATLWMTVRMDGLWRILRRAAGHDQKEGVLGRIFMWTAVIGGAVFLFWLLLIEGPGSSLGPANA